MIKTVGKRDLNKFFINKLTSKRSVKFVKGDFHGESLLHLFAVNILLCTYGGLTSLIRH